MARERRTEALRDALLPVCSSLAVELYDVQLTPGTLLVTIERPGGLDIETITAMSRAVTSLLDERDELAPGGHYELEVSSPGIERRLRLPEHFTRVIGEQVALRTIPGTPGERRVNGRLVAADESGLLVEEAAGERRVAYGEIERAHTVADWARELAGEAHTDRSMPPAERSGRRTSAAKGVEDDARFAERERASTS